MLSFDRIPPLPAGTEGEVNVVVDTPRGSRNKVKWDEALGVFTLSHVLTAGAVFPFDFGFVPGTCAEDGDAIDVLVLMEEPSFTGCLVSARLIGGIEAEQMQGERTFRNDRLLAVASQSRLYADVYDRGDLPPMLISEIENFFVSYNAMRDRMFRPTGRFGATQAMAAIRAGMRNVWKSRGAHRMTPRNTICLWFDKDAEEAARFYAATFPDSEVTAVHTAPSEYSGGKKGDVLTVQFTVLGIPCLGLNGGPVFPHSEAFSFQVATDDQQETDRYWDAIVGNGGAESQCGWCKDRWGISWQIIPRVLTDALASGGEEARRAFDAMMPMTKIDAAAIEAARRG